MTRRRDRSLSSYLPIPMIVFVVAPLLATVVLSSALVVGYLGALVMSDVVNTLSR